MPRELLRALDDDLRRLLSAGAASAPGDAGLRHRADALAALGEKVPALARLAPAVRGVVRAAPTDAAPALLDLLRLLRPLRSSLAESPVPGDVAPLSQSGPWSTTAPASDLPRVVRWVRRPSWNDGWEGVRDFFASHADLRLAGLLMDRLSQNPGDAADFVADTILPLYGSAVLPEVLPGVESPDRHVRDRSLMAVCHIDKPRGAELCRRRLAGRDAGARLEALHCLTVAAPDEAKRSALAWLGGKTTGPVRYAAWRCLDALTPMKAADLPALLRALVENYEYGASEVVVSVGRPAVRPLVELLHAPLPTIRNIAAYALGCLGAKAAPAVPALVELTRDPDESAAMTAVHALPKIGPAARAAVPRLTEMLTGGRSAGVASALVELGRDDPAAVAALVALLDARNFLARHDAVGYVARLGPAAKAAVPKLIALYRDRRTHWQFRRNILEALAKIGPAAREARPLLEKALKDREVRVRYAAALALGMLGPAGKAAVPVLVAAMHDGHDSWWWTMYGEKGLRAFASLGPAAAAAIPDLTEAARTEYSPQRRRLAREALATIRGTS
jgi:HEAT repeat protein